MSAKHTPGPWEVWGLDSDSEEDLEVGGDNGHAVCEVYGSATTKQGRANAALIAAAPAMLKALQFCVQAIRTAGLDSIPGGICAQASAEARAVISKAEDAK